MKTPNKLRKLLFFTGLLILSTQASAINFDDMNSYITDTAVTANIKAKLLGSHLFTNSKINITTDNGIVSVSGTVDTLTNASLVIQTVASSFGVRDINPAKLTVMNINQPLDDMIITAEIRGLFIRHEIFGMLPLLSKLPIAISTDQGVVTLITGQATPAQIDNAVAIAQSVRGVKVVNTQSDDDSDA